ncbi:YbgA family protein [Marinomonas posidonica]|uniref:YbgA family protein n=1 Tax=Marinomonas posidonica TaxID=936476 RepID=UPI003736422D
MPHSKYTPDQLERKIPVGISACLLGDNVRFNGGHSHSNYCNNVLSDYFDYQKFCPEVAAGFGTPRPTLRLEGDPNDPIMTFTKKTGEDLTDQFRSGSADYLDTLAHLDGYIVMKNSPSCGMERIKVYQENGHPHMKRTAGLFTKALMERYPLLPVEEDGRLNDPNLRENFLLRVFTHHDFRHSVPKEPKMKDLIEFHSRYKYLVMAHSQPIYRELGRLLSGNDPRPIQTLKEAYFKILMTCLSKPAKRKNHCNVLMHLVGYLKNAVDVSIRKDILDVVEQYRRGEVNLVTPMTLLHHYLKHHGSEYINQQSYFAPYPSPLGIRNTV